MYTPAMFHIDHTVVLSLLAVVLGCYFYIISYINGGNRSGRLPPCPVRPLPLVGHIFQLDENPRQQFKAWHKKCGDLFRIYFGRTPVVVVSGYATIRKALMNTGAALAHRPVMFANDSVGMADAGVSFSSGPAWQEMRTATMQILKELGMGSNVLAERVQEEARCFVEALAAHRGEPTDIQHLTQLCVSNVVCSVILGRRFDYGDERLREGVKNVRNLAAYAQQAAAMNYFPFLKYLPGDLLNMGRLFEAVSGLRDMFAPFCSAEDSDGVDAMVAAATADDDNDDEVKSFIASFRRKWRERLEAGETTCLDERNLLKTAMDLFAAGTETTAATISWCLLYTLRSPGVQDRIHVELDRAVGRKRQPNMSDKLRLPYLEAVIKETQRLASVAPFSLMRQTGEDVQLGGYTIPAGTSVITNLDTVLHDPSVWGEGADSEFRPERFLTGEHGDERVLHREEFIPFSIGRRSCLGMGLAQMELFLCLATMFQRFEFRLPDPNRLPSTKEMFGLTAVPTPYKVCCVDRPLPRHFLHSG